MQATGSTVNSWWTQGRDSSSPVFLVSEIEAGTGPRRRWFPVTTYCRSRKNNAPADFGIVTLLNPFAVSTVPR